MATYTLQIGPSDAIDSCIVSSNSGANYGGIDLLYIGGWGDWNYGLLQFDITGAAWPPADNVISCTINMFVNADNWHGGPPTPTSVTLNRITSSWTEGGVTWNNQPTYTTTGQVSMGTPTWDQRKVVDITQFYKDWKNGTYPNYGMMYIPGTNSNNWAYMTSTDNVNWWDRPIVEVRYSPIKTVQGFSRTTVKTINGIARASIMGFGGVN